MVDFETAVWRWRMEMMRRTSKDELSNNVASASNRGRERLGFSELLDGGGDTSSFSGNLFLYPVYLGLYPLLVLEGGRGWRTYS